MINLELRSDLQLRIRRKVETGEFPSEEAVVEQALECFLTQEPPHAHYGASSLPQILVARIPGPFLEDDAALPPVDLPRPGRPLSLAYRHVARRQPGLFPGE